MKPKLVRQNRIDSGADPFVNIREAWRGGENGRLRHLRDVHVPDEYAYADWVWKMQSISPVFQAFFDDQKFMRTMGVLDQKTYSDLTQVYPGTVGTEIGRMPAGMLLGLWGYDPDFLHDRERVLKFLKAHPEYHGSALMANPDYVSPWG